MRILGGAGRENGGVLVDAIHFFRAGDTPPALAKLPRKFLRYMQLCDARPERPSEMQEIIRQARSDRLFPGEGGLDLKGLMKALPAGIPLSLEIPVAKKMEPLERARRALAATEAILNMGEQA
jgi:sugar phosphate isomerase/epimerase